MKSKHRGQLGLIWNTHTKIRLMSHTHKTSAHFSSNKTIYVMNLKVTYNFIFIRKEYAYEFIKLTQN